MENTTTETAGAESPTLGALAGALAKAQGAMRAAAKDATNPHFKSRYADLASIWDACREPLATNGLAVMQRVSDHTGGIAITTMLVHASGEYVRDVCVYPLRERGNIQALGSAITYGRRYSLAALVGVAPDDDDDGDSASAPARARQSPVARRDTKSQTAPHPAASPQPPAKPPASAPPAAAPEPAARRSAVRARITALSPEVKAKLPGSFAAWRAEIEGPWAAGDAVALEAIAERTERALRVAGGGEFDYPAVDPVEAA